MDVSACAKYLYLLVTFQGSGLVLEIANYKRGGLIKTVTHRFSVRECFSGTNFE